MAAQKEARTRMKRLVFLLIFATATSSWGAEHFLVIQGAPGEAAYEDRFSEAAELWMKLADQTGATALLLNSETAKSTVKQRIQDWVTHPDRKNSEPIWIVYLGHGSYNDGVAKLNLPGPDLSSLELREWLEPVESQLVFIHGGSASSPFISSLSGPNRVIITATRSGTELNYARFGEQFVRAFADAKSDIDLDGNVSLLEAFISASSAVESFYLEAGRLSTEHALIDDNGDGRGTPATGFAGLRPASNRAESDRDGRLARRLALTRRKGIETLTSLQVAERNRLEQELEALYLQKDELREIQYYEELEGILNQLASLYLGEGLEEKPHSNPRSP